MPFACCTAAKWGLCFQPAFTVTATDAFTDKSFALQRVSTGVNPKKGMLVDLLCWIAPQS